VRKFELDPRTEEGLAEIGEGLRPFLEIDLVEKVRRYSSGSCRGHVVPWVGGLFPEHPSDPGYEGPRWSGSKVYGWWAVVGECPRK
jgi:hypothetical protein